MTNIYIFPLVDYIKNSPYKRAKLTYVAGPGGAPGLEDYEPSVLLYTTPRFLNVRTVDYSTFCMFFIAFAPQIP